MGESPLGYLNFKNSTVSSQASCNYKIISINKDQNTNQHSIRIGIDDNKGSCFERRSSNDESIGSCDCDSDRAISPSDRMTYQITPTSPSPQQKVSLKMIPAAQGGSRILKSGSRKGSKEDCGVSCKHDDLTGDVDEDVEHCKKVSTAKAMFENMASTSDQRLKKVKSKPKLKSWNSNSLLDNTTTEGPSPTTPTTPTTITTKFYAHGKSKSEPVELTLKDYERLSNRRRAPETTADKDNLSYDRCASANDDYVDIVSPSPLESSCPADFLKNISDDQDVLSASWDTEQHIHFSPSPPPPPQPQSVDFTTTNPTTIVHHRSSRSEIVSSSAHAQLDIQMAALPSYSSEDLRHYGKDVADTSKGSDARQPATPTTPSHTSVSAETRQQTVNSANDLREATQRYFTHVARNNPRLRNAIPGKDPNNAMKFTHTRKSSSPCEEEFLRGGTRATIATSTSVATRLGPRSKSTSESPPPLPQSQVELSELSDMLSRTCEQNSIMSRLLRGEHNISPSGGTQMNSSTNPSASILMQIPEENKNNGTSDVDLVRSRNRSDCSDSTSATSDVLLRNRDVPYGKSANTVSSRSCTSINTTANSSVNDLRNTHADTQRLHHYRGAKSTGSIVPDMNAEQVQTEARLRRGGNTTTEWMSGSTENVPGTGRSKYQISRNEHGSLHGLSSSSREMLEQDETRASNESIDSDQHIYDVATIGDDERVPSPDERTPSTSTETEGISHETDIDNNTCVTSTQVCVETDIDADEAPPLEIVHKKDLSTDSAVYVLDEHISHAKALSNVSTDSTHYAETTSPLPPYQRYDDDELSSPVPSNDGVLYDYPHDGDETNEKEKEKEKPQRTISRRKKDSSHANSRNNSCVSTDSCASTGTMDSGIVVTDSSQRTSPMSDMAPSSYYDKELNGSRETLDADIVALEKASEFSSSSSSTVVLNRDESAENAAYQLLGVSRSSSVGSGGNSSSRESNSRAGELDNEKTKLVESMREKINELRDQEQEIADEIRMNEDLGKKVQKMVQTKATQVEFGKFELFIGELNKVVALLLSLTQRLHRYELMLQDLDMSDEEDQVKKEGLVTKIDKLKSQHEEACYLRDVNDKRGDVVAVFLENYCTEEEFADFQYYVDMKSQLALMQSEIREKVKLGDARLKALELTNSEWSFK